MVTETKTGMSLEFFVDGQGVSEYFYKSNRVKSEAVDVEVSVDDYKQAVKDIKAWIEKVRRIHRDQLTVGNLSLNVDEKLHEANGEIKFNLLIGDLDLEIKFNKNTKKIRVKRSVYNLNWTDFLHFTSRYDDFISIYIAPHL